MTTTPTDPRLDHPVLDELRAIDAALDTIAAGEPTLWPTEVKARVLTKTTELLARLEGTRTKVLAAAEDVAVAEGSRNPGAWLAHHTHLTSKTGQNLWKLARALGAHPDVAEALAAGRIHVEQAAAICNGINSIPDHVPTVIVDDDGTIGIITTPDHCRPLDPTIRRQARDLLLTQAVDIDARALRQLSKRVLSIVAPEVADAHDAAWLARQEALAHRDASLSLFDDGQGRCHGKFTVPSSVGEQLNRSPPRTRRTCKASR